MKRARAVIGASYGDEGKGICTDYLCATQGAGVVVRYNSGAQAGHTVVSPDGKRHVFSTYSSGSFLNIPTYLSQFFVVNPIMFFQERDKLIKLLGGVPDVYASPDCLVTTFADMVINQRIEKHREKTTGQRHGSVGLGFGETIERSAGLPHLKITMADIWNGINLEDRLVEICGKYAQFRTTKIIKNAEPMIAAFMKGCEELANSIHPAGIAQVADLDPVFEGAQGLLLDMDNKANFPHVTRSNTGLKNVRYLCKQAGIDTIEPYYVTRTYLTKHGAGPMPGEDPKMKFHDDTNLPHAYQGTLRFAPINGRELMQRVEADAIDLDYSLVATHCDQLDATFTSTLKSYGPTRNDVR